VCFTTQSLTPTDIYEDMLDNNCWSLISDRDRGFSVCCYITLTFSPGSHPAFYLIHTGGSFCWNKVISVKLTTYIHLYWSHKNKSHGPTTSISPLSHLAILFIWKLAMLNTWHTLLATSALGWFV
jgi:hypothetical protein